MIRNDSGGTPGSSVNNSLNSLPGGATPSPDQLGGRRGPSSDLAQDSPVSAHMYCYMRQLGAWSRSLITDFANLVPEWTSSVNEHTRECFIISLVEAANNLHDGAPQPVP